MEGDKDLFEKSWEFVVGGHFTVFAQKAVVDEFFSQKSTDSGKSFVENDASHLHPYSMCQPNPTGLYTRWDLDSETGIFTPRQKTRPVVLKIWSCPIFKEQEPHVKLKSSTLKADTKKLTVLVLIGFYFHNNTVFEAMV